MVYPLHLQPSSSREAVQPKADVRLEASIGINRPIADIRLRKVEQKVYFNLLPQVVHFALTSTIESVTLIQPQYKGWCV